MSDLISRQAVKDAINEHLELATSGFGSDSIVKKIYKMAYNHVIDVISILPAIQSEQKTGRWEHDGGHFANRWICSQCGYKFYFEKSEAKYCPNCGAKMESDKNDN